MVDTECPYNTSRQYVSKKDMPGDEAGIVADLTDMMWALIQIRGTTDAEEIATLKTVVAWNQGKVMGALMVLRARR